MYIHNSNHSHDDYKSARHTQRQLALALLAPKPWWLRRTRDRVMGIPVFLYFPIIAVVFLTYLCPISLVLFPGARWFRVPSLPSGDNGITHCPGYHAFSVQQTLPGQFTVDLGLHGTPCSIYGQDIPLLKLEVTYQSRSTVRVKFSDLNEPRYQVPPFVIQGPINAPVDPETSLLTFNFTTWPDPFQFQILRRSTGEALFDTSRSPIVFKNQYLFLKTVLPNNANIFGLGEHTGTFRFNTSEECITRTLWARDSPGIPYPSNLYGAHPIYVEYRQQSQMAHGVFLKNSNGMDIKIRNESNFTSLEYNVIGGILDFYFFAGDGGPGNEGDAKAVAREYSEVIGTSIMPPYWNLGLHQCRWGYRDWFEVAEVAANYSAAKIPLETMWTDIDYMSHRHIFTLDPENFPKNRMRQVVEWLHDRGQRYIVIVDPAVPYNETVDGHDYQTFLRAVQHRVFLMRDESHIYKGVVWPGVVAFPDWFHKNTTSWWVKEFEDFFNERTGVDVDGVWIDMNEPSNFCSYPCSDPEWLANQLGLPPPTPPKRKPPRKILGFPSSGSDSQTSLDPDSDNILYEEWHREFAPKLASLRTRNSPRVKQSRGLRPNGPSLNPNSLLKPPYNIHNDWPNGLSDKTIDTDLRHSHGYHEYDVHNLFGTLMGYASYAAMLHRRPQERPVVIGRSTFPGAQRKLSHWLGDNESSWEQYRGQIAYMLGFSAIYQMPFVGSDICGFLGDTTPGLCARWATLGAFNPFMRNHNWINTTVSQEFYRWPLVAEAARKAIDVRYRLLDYFYTALWRQSRDGTPAMMPVWMGIGKGGVDDATLHLEYQFLYGDGLMVAPVIEENSTSVWIYFPTGTKQEPVTWFHFGNLTTVDAPEPPSPESPESLGFWKDFHNISYTDIPLFWKSGNIVPMRTDSGNTTSEVRKQNFEILVIAGDDGIAEGVLYLDDGASLVQHDGAKLTMLYLLQRAGEKSDVLSVRNVEYGGLGLGDERPDTRGHPDYFDVRLEKATILGVKKHPRHVSVGGNGKEAEPLSELKAMVKTVKGEEKWKGWMYDGGRKLLVIQVGVYIYEEFEILIGF